MTSKKILYDRAKVVTYAEKWWNGYNPAYRKIPDNDCTNFVSQCLRAGGAPMTFTRGAEKGWWYSGSGGARDSWSFSWVRAHSLRWFLGGSRTGLTAVQVADARELSPGDVICYDFDGDGRWQHNTIVIAKDEDGQPLVNAHTYASRNRPWSYQNSPAYTTNCRYLFFRINDWFLI